MYQGFLSWRFLTAKRINWVGIVGVYVGVTALILILSIMSGFLEQQRRMVRGSLAHLVVEPSAADQARLPKSADAIHSEIIADERVESASPQLSWFAMVMQGGAEGAVSTEVASDTQYSKLIGVQLVGVDAEEELSTTDFLQSLQPHPKDASPKKTRGSTPVVDPSAPFSPPPGLSADGPWAWCVVGQQLAAVHLLSRGSEINLGTMVPDPKTGEIRQSNRKFLVAGTFHTGENEIDLGRIYMAREELHDFLGSYRDYSQVLVRLNDYDGEAQEVVRDLSAQLTRKGLIIGMLGEIKTWEEYRGNLLRAIENEKVMMAIMLSLVLVVAGFTVFAILTMTIAEKRRDIGILSALGATPTGTMWIFLLIGFWDALLGAFGGAVTGVLGAHYIDSIELKISQVLGVQIFDRDVYLFDHIPSVVDPVSVAVIVFGAFLCTLTFAAIPAWRASRMNPIDALRYE